MGSDALAQVLRPLASLFPTADHADLLVGLNGFDDAAVYRLTDDEAIIATVDFFPPIVDDPYDFGAIAAANAMSDIFAMGGEVLLGLNLLAWPSDVGVDLAATVLMGGAEKVLEAGAVVAGGHTIIDREPKYGLTVIGRVHPERILCLSGARPGDVLVLTKQLGTGLITTALKAGAADASHVAGAVTAMKALNQVAGRAAAARAHAATDVTGFALAGHGLKLAEQSSVALRIELAMLPVLEGALDYAAAGFLPGGTERNRAAYRPRMRGLEGLDPATEAVLFDAQTSGGLLVALAEDDVADYLSALAESGVRGHVIGSVEAGEGIEVY